MVFLPLKCYGFLLLKCYVCFYVSVLFFVLTPFCQFINKWMLLLLMTADKEECQTPKKMTITKLATPQHAHCPSQQSAEDGTRGKHQCFEQLV